MTEQEAFEQFFEKRWPEFSHSRGSAFEVWKAACEYQKEQDALVCDRMIKYGLVSEAQQRYNTAYRQCRDNIRWQGEMK